MPPGMQPMSKIQFSDNCDILSAYTIEKQCKQGNNYFFGFNTIFNSELKGKEKNSAAKNSFHFLRVFR